MKKTIYLNRNSDGDFVLSDEKETSLIIIDKDKLVIDAKDIYEKIYIPEIDYMPLEIVLENQIKDIQHLDKVIFKQVEGLFNEINNAIKEEYEEKTSLI